MIYPHDKAPKIDDTRVVGTDPLTPWFRETSELVASKIVRDNIARLKLSRRAMDRLRRERQTPATINEMIARIQRGERVKMAAGPVNVNLRAGSLVFRRADGTLTAEMESIDAPPVSREELEAGTKRIYAE